jgi:GT2 family glycosyltransferase
MRQVKEEGPRRVGAEVDIVIATRDRPVQLLRSLESLASQTFDCFQVIVVDDGSRPPIESHLAKFNIGVGPVRVVRNEASVGAAASRNRGVAEGGAPIVLFLDDDALAHRELVARHHKVLSQAAEPVVSFGPLLKPLDLRLEPWNLWEADRLNREYSRLRRGESEPSWIHLYTGNLAVRRVDFEGVDGFDGRFVRQEDIELGLRLSRAGCRFVFEPLALVWHETHRSLEKWLEIPAASAYYDLLIEKSSPEIDGFRFVEERLRQKHWLLRLARKAFSHPRVARCAVWVAIPLGRGLHLMRLERLSLMAFSLVWDLQYSGALIEASSIVRRVQKSQRQ